LGRGAETRKLSAGSIELLLTLEAVLYLDESEPALDDVRLEVEFDFEKSVL